MQDLSGVTAADVQRVATRLIHDGAFASVVLGNSEVLKAQIERYGKVEIMGEIAPKSGPGTEPKSAPKSESNVKPQVRPPAKP
jgi:hypothetical protein